MKRKIVIPESGLHAWAIRNGVAEPKFLLLMTWLVVIPGILHYGLGW